MRIHYIRFRSGTGDGFEQWGNRAEPMGFMATVLTHSVRSKGIYKNGYLKTLFTTHCVHMGVNIFLFYIQTDTLCGSTATVC